jgi:hypothetical protein
MAFNNVGPQVWLDEGGDTTWWYTRDGGSNYGTQLASADIKIGDPANPGPVLQADQQGKRVTFDGATWITTYYVRITNKGPGAANYNLQGGGMV